MTTHPWDTLPTSDGFARWTEPGDTIKGTIVDVGIGQDLSGNDCPQVLVDTGDSVVTITASQAQLRAKMLEARPNLGDTIVVLFSGIEKRAGGKELKQFDVAVKAGNGAAPTTPTSAADDTPTPAGKPSAADLL